MISILVATYGEDHWREMALTRAFASAMKQDGDYEVVIEHQRKGDVATSRNRAAKKAAGEWLLFLDADDELAPGFIQHMERAIKRRDGNLLLTPRISYVVRGRHKPPRFWPVCSLKTGNWLIIGTLVPKNTFMEVGGFRPFPHGLEDWNFWSRCVRSGATIKKVPPAVYIAHHNSESAHHQLAKDRRKYMKHYHEARCDAWPELCT